MTRACRGPNGVKMGFLNFVCVFAFFFCQDGFFFPPIFVVEMGFFKCSSFVLVSI